MIEPTSAQHRMVEDLASRGWLMDHIALGSGIPREVLTSEYQAEMRKGWKQAFEGMWLRIVDDISRNILRPNIPALDLKGMEPEAYIVQIETRLWEIGGSAPQSDFIDERLVRFVGVFDPALLALISPSDLTTLAQLALGDGVALEDVETMQKERMRR
jgi:hypothetical protein